MLVKLAISLLLAAQVIITGPRIVPRATGSCSTPVVTSRLAAYDPALTCNTGHACRNGDIADGFHDSAGSNNTTDAYGGYAGGISTPSFLASAINGKPAIQFNSYQGLQYPTTNITATKWTIYVVFRLHDLSNNQDFISGLIYDQGAGLLRYSPVPGYGSVYGSHPPSAGAWYARLATYDSTTGDLSISDCSGGSCTVDNTANIAGAGAPPTVTYLLGGVYDIAELDITTGSTSTANYGCYTQATYGI